MPKTTPSTVLQGNMGGVSLLIGNYPGYLSGGANVTLSGHTGSAGATVAIHAAAGGTGAGAGIALAAGTQTATTNTVALLNSNGVTFGMAGSTAITATVKTDYQSSGAYLTTAAQSAHTHSLHEIADPASDARFLMGTRQVQFQWGSNMTTFTTGANRGGMFEIDIAGGYTGTDHIDVVHIHQSVSNPVLHLLHIEAVGTNAMGIHLDIAGPVAVEINKPISFSGGSVPMILGTSQSNSVANLNAQYLQGRQSSQMAGTITGITGGIGLTANTSGVSVSVPAYLTTAQPPGAYLTTARASNDAVGLATAQTAVTWTVNSAGISLNAGAYLTTAANSTHSHGNPTLALTNLTGTTASASNGFTLSLSAAAAGGGGVGLNTAQTNVTWTVNTSGISLNAGGYAGTGTSATNASVTLNTNGLAISVAAPGGGAAITLSSYEPYPIGLLTGTTAVAVAAGTSGIMSLYPFTLHQYVAAGMMDLVLSGAFLTVGTSSGRQTGGLSCNLYFRGTGTNRTTLSVMDQCAFTWQVTGNNSSYTIAHPTTTNFTTYVGGTTNSAGSNITSGYTGAKLLQMPIGMVLAPGEWWFGLLGTNSTSSINCGLSFSVVGLNVSVAAMTALAPVGSFSSAYSTGTAMNDNIGGPWHRGMGSWSTAGATSNPDTLAMSRISAGQAYIPMLKFWST